jgi:hypothetical protein
MNPVTGEKKIIINGVPYVMKFTWKALSEIEQRHGDKPDLFNAEIVADVAAAGLRERHPEMTAEVLMNLSPPLAPFIRDVQQALQWAYFGPEAIPADKGVKKNRPAAGLWRRIARRFWPGPRR